MQENEQALERRLIRECRTRHLGALGDRGGVNVAKVEVQWWKADPGLGHFTTSCYEGGYYTAYASGDEPECEGEYGTIYNVFDKLVTEALDARVEKGEIDGYEILDTYSA